jgi:hypothetical protein
MKDVITILSARCAVFSCSLLRLLADNEPELPSSPQSDQLLRLAQKCGIYVRLYIPVGETSSVCERVCVCVFFGRRKVPRYGLFRV